MKFPSLADPLFSIGQINSNSVQPFGKQLVYDDSYDLAFDSFHLSDCVRKLCDILLLGAQSCPYNNYCSSSSLLLFYVASRFL